MQVLVAPEAEHAQAQPVAEALLWLVTWVSCSSVVPQSEATFSGRITLPSGGPGCPLAGSTEATRSRQSGHVAGAPEKIASSFSSYGRGTL